MLGLDLQKWELLLKRCKRQSQLFGNPEWLAFLFSNIKNNKMEPFKQWIDHLIEERVKHNDAFNELAFLKEVKVMIEYYETETQD